LYTAGLSSGRAGQIDNKPTKLVVLSPEILEARRRQLGIAHRVLDVLVAEVGLQGARVVALIGQSEAAGMTQHVRMRFERQPGGSTGALDHASEPGSRERRTALRGEDERRSWLLFALQAPKRAQLVANDPGASPASPA